MCARANIAIQTLSTGGRQMAGYGPQSLRRPADLASLQSIRAAIKSRLFKLNLSNAE
jgi:hypothetical protein